MFATGKTMGLAVWIIDDTCLVQISNDEAKVDVLGETLEWRGELTRRRDQF